MPEKKRDSDRAKAPARKNTRRLVRVTAEQARRLRSRTDWARVDAKSEADIARDIANDEDTMEFTNAMFDDARYSVPEPKQLVSIRVDASVLEFFRATGKGYLSRMNAVLRSYARAQERLKSRPASRKSDQSR